MTLYWPQFTVRPDDDDPLEHQPRERATQCSRCAGTTFNVHAVCDSCIDAGRGSGTCGCCEGRRARVKS